MGEFTSFFWLGQAAVLVAVGVMLWLMPRLTRRELFFSVTVPADFRDSEAGRAITTAYRVRVALHTAAALALMGVLVTAGRGWGLSDGARLGLAANGPFFWLIGAAVLAFLRGRREARSHAVVPSGLREAALTPARLIPPAFWLLFVLPGLACVAAGAHLWLHWDAIPERFVSHWNAAGQADGWMGRTPGAVFGPLVVALLTCGLMAGVAALIAHARPARLSGRAGEAYARFRLVGILLLALLNLVVTGSMAAAAAYVPFRAPGPMPSGLVEWLIGAAVLLPLVVLLVFLWMGQGGAAMAGAAEAAADGPPLGDRTADQCWKLGLIYFNPDDPALMVEKRFGIGWTLNFANKKAWLLMGVLVVFIVVTLAVSFWSAR